MSQFCALFFFIFVCFISSNFGIPIIDSENVGAVSLVDKQIKVTGQNNYPYIVNIEIKQTKNRKRVSSSCAGVIIGLDTVLTAGHCLYKKNDPEVIIWAGIVDLRRENDEGQKIVAKDFVIHKNYQEQKHERHHSTFDENDIAIVWADKEFKFGPNVAISKLNRNIEKPFNIRGYILGWGDNGKLLAPTMLQKGLVKVIPADECQNFNKQIIIPDTVICLGSVNKKTRAADGDSGGPFVIDGVVYGISSLTIYESRHKRKALNLFTYVASYSKWIGSNLLQGPPIERTPKPTKPGRRRSLSN